MWDHYNRPVGFGYDVLDYEEEGIWHAENAQKLMAVIDERARHYRTDEILVLFGDDFQYMQADQNFAQMDNMIEYMNMKHGNKYNFMYSTPSQYIDAINQYNVTWPTKYDDGFPYSDKASSYWTGYFTSRPNFKQYVRRASSSFRASGGLFAQKVIAHDLRAKELTDIILANYALQDPLAIAQHHDAVSGTSREGVVADYEARLFHGMEQSNKQYAKLLAAGIQRTTGFYSDSEWTTC